MRQATLFLFHTFGLKTGIPLPSRMLYHPSYLIPDFLSKNWQNNPEIYFGVRSIQHRRDHPKDPHLSKSTASVLEEI